MLIGIKIAFIVILLLIIAVAIMAWLSGVRMNRQTNKEAAAVLAGAVPQSPEIIQSADLQGLPACVQQWLQRSNIIGKEKIHTVRLKQAGRMRTGEGKPWMPLEAVQYINVDQPGFVWQVKVKAAPLVYLMGRDQYDQGQGSMKIKLLSLWPVADVSPGPEMNQSALLRYLAEIIWYPTAALNSYIQWDAIDVHTARATMTWQGVRASLVFTFNDAGAMVSAVGPRYREANGKFELTGWGCEAYGYRTFQDIGITNQGNVIWKYETGDFNWLQIEVTDLEYNTVEPY